MNNLMRVCIALFCLLFLPVFAQAQMSHPEQVEDVAFSADGKLLASISATELKIWDVESGALVSTFSPGGGRVQFIGATSDVLIQIGRVVQRVSAKGELIRTYEKSSASTPAITPDASAFVITEPMGRSIDLISISLETGEIIERKQLLPVLQAKSADFHLAFTRDGSSLYAINSGELRIFTGGELVKKFLVDEKDLVNALVIGKTNYAYATKYFNGNVALGGDPAKANSEYETSGIHQYFDVALNPLDESIMAVASYTDILLYGTKKGKPRKAKTGKEYNRCIAYSPDGKFIAVGMGLTREQKTKESAVKLFSADKLKLVKVFLPPKE